MKSNSILDSSCYCLILLKLAIGYTIIHIVGLRCIENTAIHNGRVIPYSTSFDEKFL